MNSLHEQARVALDAKANAERELAAAVHCPPWRHLVFGLLMGALIATPAFSMMTRFAMLAVILCAIGVIVQYDRRRLGVFINGYRRGKTRIVAIITLIVELGLYAYSCVRGLDHGDTVTPLLLAIAGIIFGTAASLVWQRVFTRELGA